MKAVNFATAKAARVRSRGTTTGRAFASRRQIPPAWLTAL